MAPIALGGRLAEFVAPSLPPRFAVSLVSGGTVSPPAYLAGVVVANVTVGTGPTEMGYDSGNGYVYVANYGSNNVSVINGTSAVATIMIGPYPQTVGYDSGNGYVYVGDLNSNNLSVISGTSVITTVTVGYSPDGMGYDGGNGYVYVANSVPNNVSVIDGTSVVGTVKVGSHPWGVGYDSGNGYVYVANDASNNVSVIDGTSVVGTVKVGSYPADVGYDSGNGYVYIANLNSNSVSVVNGTSVVGTVSVGSSPGGVGYDSGNGYVYVANYGSDSVSVINGTSVLATVKVGPSPVGVGYDAGNGYVYVADSSSNNVSVISTELELGGIAGPGTLDVGQSDPFSAPIIAPGAGSLHEYVNVTPSTGLACLLGSPSSLKVSATCTSSAPGNYDLNISAVDRLGNSVWTSLPVMVSPDPTVSVPSANRTSADAGEVARFSAVATHGIAPYVEYHWEGLPNSCGTSTPVPNVTCPLGLAGAISVRAAVTDSAGVTSPWSSSLFFTVYEKPVVGLPTVNRTVADVGQWVEFYEGATLGSGVYAYSWLGLPPECPSSGMPIECKISTVGTFAVTVFVTDSNGVSTGDSVPLRFQTFSDVVVNLTASRSAVDPGQWVTLNATASGGAGPLSYNWSGLPFGCPTANSSTVACSPLLQGSYSISVAVTDAADFAVTSKPVSLAVNRALEGTATGNPSSAQTGQPVQFRASAQGGSGTYNFAWNFGDGGAATGAIVNHSFAKAGTYPVLVWINDSLGGTVVRSWNVTVSAVAGAGPSGATFFGLPLLEVVGIVLVAAALIGTIAVYVMRRHRRGRSPED
jgi:YVTN family beta-propeller protein